MVKVTLRNLVAHPVGPYPKTRETRKRAISVLQELGRPKEAASLEAKMEEEQEKRPEE